MYLTVKQEIKHLTKTEYLILRELCHTAKNLNNEALYNVRQHFFDEGTYLNYESNYRLLKESPNYKTLNSNVAQQIIKETDGQFKSFFGLLKLAKEGKYQYKDIHIPHYLPKNGFTTLIIGFVRLNGNNLTIPYSNSYKKTHKPIEITIPPNIADKEVKEIRIIPKCNARFFEAQYTYKADYISRNLNINNALALDMGIDNLLTAASSTGKSFIIDGRRLKSINGITKKIQDCSVSKIGKNTENVLQNVKVSLNVSTITESMIILVRLLVSLSIIVLTMILVL